MPGLRPSGDRVRETLFNWLQGKLAGAHCLDLFAGSGALGLEALSRYASSTTFVELDPLAMANIRKSCTQLGAEVETWPGTSGTTSQVRLFQGAAQDALEQLRHAERGPLYDLVFIDPPFQLQCQWQVLDLLVPGLLRPDALVYIEAPSEQRLPEQLPAGFELLREKTFTEVTARLVQWGSH